MIVKKKFIKISKYERKETIRCTWSIRIQKNDNFEQKFGYIANEMQMQMQTKYIVSYQLLLDYSKEYEKIGEWIVVLIIILHGKRLIPTSDWSKSIIKNLITVIQAKYNKFVDCKEKIHKNKIIHKIHKNPDGPDKLSILLWPLIHSLAFLTFWKFYDH